ncbi:uncharacterized protein B0I36DRAFT_308983 [Microdochium trichocladiopsis]|uniref:Uncharacterized protein n=1 Tax=Microdochium trichocladiopsis TaxID=1682393 RepID=A0A9P8YGM9_9PEZI|nr:uncharacterized protein B0I36DRAFT_308983 [Microdochium trichocladiopsis]KAH7039623.1 hypothetical protein B0I36DRAFT_308983 [Microdochium trichocladiopsis]
MIAMVHPRGCDTARLRSSVRPKIRCRSVHSRPTGSVVKGELKGAVPGLPDNQPWLLASQLQRYHNSDNKTEMINMWSRLKQGRVSSMRNYGSPLLRKRSHSPLRACVPMARSGLPEISRPLPAIPLGLLSMHGRMTPSPDPDTLSARKSLEVVRNRIRTSCTLRFHNRGCDIWGAGEGPKGVKHDRCVGKSRSVKHQQQHGTP